MTYKSDNLYSSKERAAPSLNSLLDYLSTEDNGNYYYRGQTKHWPGPLFPSGYRNYRRTGNTYSNSSKEYVLALRKIGRHFIGLDPINSFSDSLYLFYPENIAPTEEEKILLEWLRTNQYFARSMQLGEKSFLSVLSEEELRKYRHNLKYWKQAVDNHHRVTIRDFVFMEPFGYLLGQALSQQYGFSSEMLDITSDIAVAAFFASYESPTYLNKPKSGIGVIYRFLRTEGYEGQNNITDYNFYTCPEMLDIQALFSGFIGKEGDSLKRQEVENFLVDSFKAKTWRRLELLKVSGSILQGTRFSRQSAAFLVPDLLFLETKTDKKIPNGFIVFMALEDLSVRDGTDIFYFHHTKDNGTHLNINREYLWPNESDVFIEMLGNALTFNVITESGRILPNRIDLLDPGFK